ncbi:hypothetical protein FOA52_005301 [Chlamydomonas sp. UWO 241]|nr:hypothetical protein FOA52_005301 [Chlamydomonas sp. UWO 241]
MATVMAPGTKESEQEALVQMARSEAHSEEPDEHEHTSQRSPWLRAMMMGALDGLLSVASVMLGVGGGTGDLRSMRLAGIAACLAGALSMFLGEYASVSAQRDSEAADIEKERQMQNAGPVERAHEQEELAQIYVNRGLTPELARQVAEELTAHDVIRAHARDELGIDLDDMADPLQAGLVDMVSFVLGAAIPLLVGSFIQDSHDCYGSEETAVAAAAVRVAAAAVDGVSLPVCLAMNLVRFVHDVSGRDRPAGGGVVSASFLNAKPAVGGIGVEPRRGGVLRVLFTVASDAVADTVVRSRRNLRDVDPSAAVFDVLSDREEAQHRALWPAFLAAKAAGKRAQFHRARLVVDGERPLQTHNMALRSTMNTRSVQMRPARISRVAAVKPVAALNVKHAAAFAAVAAVVATVAAPAEASQVVSSIASAAEGYPFVPPSWAPSVLVPLTGLVLPGVVMASLFVYIEKDA